MASPVYLVYLVYLVCLVEKKSNLKMKSGGLKESLTALKSHVESLVIESMGDRVLGIWMVDFKMKSERLKRI